MCIQLTNSTSCIIINNIILIILISAARIARRGLCLRPIFSWIGCTSQQDSRDRASFFCRKRTQFQTFQHYGGIRSQQQQQQ